MSNETPAWLTEEFISNALQDSETNVKICNLEVDRPIPKGSNFMCDIFRAKALYKSSDSPDGKEVSFIIKCPIIGSKTQKLIEAGMMQKEVRFYKEYLPKLNQFLHEEEYIIAKSYSSSKEGVLVFEDLNYSGHKMVDRLVQLDYDHSVIAIKALAKFHAASVKIKECDPELLEEIGKESLFTANGVATEIGIDHTVSLCFKLLGYKLKELSDFEKYAEKIINYSDTAWDIASNIVKAENNAFNVLNHGDFWVTNMLFKYDKATGKPVSVKLIDLQMSRYCSPAIDLLNFLSSSVQEDVRSKKANDIINCYFDELNINLERFSASRRLEYAELLEHLKEREFFAILSSIAMLPIFIQDANSAENVDFDKLISEKDITRSPLRPCFENEKYINIMQVRLLEYEKNGWL